MRRLVIGDIHGNYLALKQVLERSNFNYDEDLLISLGDVCDGWHQTRQCVDELLKIKNHKNIMGNHDYWLVKWLESWGTYLNSDWYMQGGKATIESYGRNIENVPPLHKEFFRRMLPYVVMDNKLFVHAGFNPDIPIGQQDTEDLMWSRQIPNKIKVGWQDMSIFRGSYDEVYIGHTTTQYLKTLKPVIREGIHLLDTGAGWDGVLTIMDIDTKEYWQSDPAEELYPGVRGR